MKVQPFKLEEWFAKYEFSAPYQMCNSDCESMTIEELLSFEEGAKEDFLKQKLGYTEVKGNPKLREEIAKLYTHLTSEDILVDAGGEGPIFNFMNAVLSSGDHVIVQSPTYESLYKVPLALGCEVSKWESSMKDAWELDLNTVKKKIKKNTKVIVLNLPNNPTVYLATKEKLQEIIDIAKQRGIIVFCDEVYRMLEYDEKDRLPAVCDMYENGVSLGVMSKAFGLPGLRIGWLATRNKELIDRVANFKLYNTICSSGPSEYLSTVALRHNKEIIQRNLEIIGNNLQVLDAFFARHPQLFTWQKPKAGPIAFPEINFPQGAEAFSHELVENEGILIAPGTVFEAGDKNIRIGFGRKNLPECIPRLDKFLNNLGETSSCHNH